MPVTSAAKRYAQAVFEIAVEDNKLEEWRSDLIKITQLKEDAEFVAMAENPKLSAELKLELAKGKLGPMNPQALNLAYLLIAKGRLKDADQIAKEYARLLDEYYGITHAQVTTAIQVNDIEKKIISNYLEMIVGKQVSIDIKVAPEILGGFVAKIGDKLIDGSIRNKLNELKKNLVQTRG